MRTRLPRRSWSFRSCKNEIQNRYWSTISSARRLRVSPMVPVAQKVQCMAQPTCVLMHAVHPSRALRRRTDSITQPSSRLRATLNVSPSTLSRTRTDFTLIQGRLTASAWRMDTGKEVTSSHFLKEGRNKASSTCFQRKSGSFGKRVWNRSLREEGTIKKRDGVNKQKLILF